MPTHARVEIKPTSDGYRLIVDGVDITRVVSANNFRIYWDHDQPVITLDLLPTADLTADLPNAILRLASSPAEPSATPAEPSATEDTPAGSEFVQFLADMRRDLDVLMGRTPAPDDRVDPQ